MDKDLEIVCLKKLAEGDHTSYEALFLHYHPKIHHFLCGFIKNEEEAFDMTQDIFFKIWTNRKQIGDITSFKAYLFSMAKNMIYNYYEHSLVVEKYHEKQKSLLRDILPEEEFFAKELHGLIELMVEQMPEQRRRVYKMSRVEGLSNDEIASQLNINKRTVENHLTNALHYLRQQINKTLLLFFL